MTPLCQNGTLDGTAGNLWTAVGEAGVARFDMASSASARWWTSSTDVARGRRAHLDGEVVQVPPDDGMGGFAINASDATFKACNS